MVLTFLLEMMMRTLDKDFKHLRIRDSEMSFSMGFTTAILLVVVILKLFGVIL